MPQNILWVLNGASNKDLIAKWNTSVGRKAIQFFLEGCVTVVSTLKQDAKLGSSQKQISAVLLDYVSNLSCETLPKVSSKEDTTRAEASRPSEQNSPVNKIKYWAFSNTTMKSLGDCMVTNLMAGRLLNELATALKTKRSLPIMQSAINACDHEIKVYYNEALLAYNNVFKEAHSDRQVDDVKAEAKKAALETFMKCAPAKLGNPASFKAQLNSLFNIFHEKDKILRNPTTGKLQ